MKDVAGDGPNFVKITAAEFAEVLFGVLHTVYLLASRFRHVARLFSHVCTHFGFVSRWVCSTQRDEALSHSVCKRL